MRACFKMLLVFVFLRNTVMVQSLTVTSSPIYFNNYVPSVGTTRRNNTQNIRLSKTRVSPKAIDSRNFKKKYIKPLDGSLHSIACTLKKDKSKGPECSSAVE